MSGCIRGYELPTAAIAVIAVIAVVDTIDSVPTIMQQQSQPHGAACGIG